MLLEIYQNSFHMFISLEWSDITFLKKISSSIKFLIEQSYDIRHKTEFFCTRLLN